MDYASAGSKADATARMYSLGGTPAEPLGPGSKEKRSALEALGCFLGVERLAPGKTEAGRALAERLGVTWDDSCYSLGDTITLIGLNRLVDAAVLEHASTLYDELRDEFLIRVMSAKLSDRYDRDARVAREQELNVPEDLTDLEENIAELIAQLSGSSQTPEGVEPASSEIDPSSVRLDDGSWRERLADVQGWLHFPDDLDVSSPGAFDASLRVVLRLDDTDDESMLFAGLAERLERAVALRDEFAGRMEETAEGAETLATATQAWVNAWEDADDEDAEESASDGAPINAVADTWPIQEFVQRAKDDELNLSPSYQRADVWATPDAQLLIESILRGIPLPSVIILEQTGESTNYEVVDGKQRLTSILRFIGAHPRATALVAEKAKLWDDPSAMYLFRDDYPAFKKLWNQRESEKLTATVERRLYFPFPLRSPKTGPLRPGGDLAQLRGKYYSAIKDATVQVQDNTKKIKSIFEEVSEYKVPVIKYKKVTPAQVHEVFSLYNKQGKHLNAEEIRNALYHELALMKALLVTAGDAEDVASVAPFLAAEWDELRSASETLDKYGFGRVGYKRTKILSWVSATLLLNDGVQGRATASHITALLKRVQDDKKDPMRDTPRVKDLMTGLDLAVDAHAIVEDNDGWAKKFRNGQGGAKWQELQLVAAITGLTAASIALGEKIADAVDDVTPTILEASKTWNRPSSVQSKDQWDFISMVVGELLDVLGVDPAEADRAISQRFGHSGLMALLSA